MTLEAIFNERMKVVPIAYHMQQRGVTVNANHLEHLISKYSTEAKQYAEVCSDIASSYNYPLVLSKGGTNNSLRIFLLDTLDLPIVKVVKGSGNPCFDKNALEHYENTLEHDSAPQQFVASLRAMRKRITSISYLEGYKRFWKPMDGESDWYVLHPNLNPTGTSTLRWSSNNPNEQNISKQGMYEGDTETLRYCFGPSPGREWWSLDAKNIELRIPAYESNEEDLIALFEQPDTPPYFGSNHILVFHILHPDKWNEVLKEVGIDKVGPACKKKYASTWYQWTKNGNFALIYGAVDREDGLGTADIAYHMPGAQSIIKQRFAKQEALNQYWIKYAEKHGCVETLPDKAVDPKRGYPVMCTRTEYGRIKPTVPLNYHVQSSACWALMRMMIKCQGQLDEWNSKVVNVNRDGYHLNMQIHDELVFDFPKRAHPKKNPKQSNLARMKVIKGLMESVGEDLIPRVPLPVGLEYHETSWAEGIGL